MEKVSGNCSNSYKDGAEAPLNEKWAVSVHLSNIQSKGDVSYSSTVGTLLNFNHVKKKNVVGANFQV